ncbi:MAG: hypothetical protein AAB420_00255 [Patescibacteria group bacterium]
MAIVNFTIPKELERQVTAVIKKRGFASKAEFFRFSAMRFVMEESRKPFATQDERRAYLVQEIEREIAHRFKGKKFPSLEKVLANV